MPCEFRILNARQSSYSGGWWDYRACASYDGEHWFRVHTEHDGQVLEIHHTPERDVVAYACFPPYPTERHEGLLARVRASGRLGVVELGKSFEGRPMNAVICGDQGRSVPRIWIIAHQHPGETMAGWFMEGVLHRMLDEGDPEIVDATMRVVAQECAAAESLGTERVERWTHHRNDTSALQALTRKGFVVDTLEIAAPWARLVEVFDEVRAAMLAVPHARASTCHLSHSYPDGACLYFTFAATPPADEVDATYVALWDAGQRAVLAHGGNLSHHHGVGLNRSRFVREALGPAFEVLAATKRALDPQGILNPGKLGLPSPFGEVVWP